MKTTHRTFTIDIKSAVFGAWRLGYARVSVSILGAQTEGIALYAAKSLKVHRAVVAPTLKDAIDFFATHKVPARHSAQVLRRLFDDNGAYIPNEPEA